MNVPPTRFGNDLAPIRGAPNRGPGCYENEDVSNFVSIKLKFNHIHSRQKTLLSYHRCLSNRKFDRLGGLLDERLAFLAQNSTGCNNMISCYDIILIPEIGNLCHARFFLIDALNAVFNSINPV